MDQFEDEWNESMEQAGDALEDGFNCIEKHMFDDEALAECQKWAGKDCADEEQVEAKDKAACEA